MKKRSLVKIGIFGENVEIILDRHPRREVVEIVIHGDAGTRKRRLGTASIRTRVD